MATDYPRTTFRDDGTGPVIDAMYLNRLEGFIDAIAEGGAGSVVKADNADRVGGLLPSEIQMTDQEVLDAVKRVDGSGSGLDADTLDGKHLSDLTSSFISATDGETMALGKPCYIGADGKSYIASKNDITKIVVVGLWASSGKVQKSGPLTNGAWALTPGNVCYLGDSGAIIQDVDLIDNIHNEATVVLGVATSATTIEIAPEAPILYGDDYGDTQDFPVISGRMGTVGPITGPAKIDFNEFWIARGITYDSANRRFYVPRTGLYRITLNAHASAAATRFAIGINNDAPTAATNKGQTYTNVASVGESLDSLLSLNAGDYVVFYVVSGNSYNSVGDYFGNFSIKLEEAVSVRIREAGASAIEESGSNSNGSYIKFTDGTLMQRGYLDITAYPHTVNFATAFIDTNFALTVLVTHTSSITYFTESSPASNRTNQSAKVWFYNGAQVTSGKYSYIAIGRWKA